MPNSAGKLWSDNPYAPHISDVLYVAEKNYFAGALIGAIFYGTPTYVFAYLYLPSAGMSF